MSGEASNDDLQLLLDEQGRVEQLLACRGRGLGLGFGRRGDRAHADEAKVKWTKDLGDPELKKNLRILHQLIDGAVAVCERSQRGDPSATARSDRERLITSRLLELARRVGLPRDRPLTLEALLEHRFEVEQLLIELGDEPYLRTRAHAVYDEGDGTYVRWRDMFGDELPPLAAAADDGVEATRQMLQRLMAAKASQDHAMRARRELKGRVLGFVLPVLVVATGLFGLALGIVEHEVGTVLLAGTAGLSGAALGGLLKLRDEVIRGAQLREFTPFYFGQLLLGVTAGLIGFAVDQSGIVDVAGETAGVATFAFALGFSEAAFLRLIARIGEPAPGGKET